MQHNKKIYPDLDEIPNHENKGDNFRLNEVSKCLTLLRNRTRKTRTHFQEIQTNPQLAKEN